MKDDREIGSLSGEYMPTLRQTVVNSEDDVFIEVLCKESSVDVNLFKPVVSICDLGTSNWHEPALSYWGFDVTDVQKLQQQDSNLSFQTINIVILSKKISNDQEPIQSDLTSCPQSQKGNN